MNLTLTLPFIEAVAAVVFAVIISSSFSVVASGAATPDLSKIKNTKTHGTKILALS